MPGPRQRQRHQSQGFAKLGPCQQRGLANAGPDGDISVLALDARELGLARLSLETGSWDYFAPARALYRRCGFSDCAPFADYRPDPHSVFMSLELPPAPPTPP